VKTKLGLIFLGAMAAACGPKPKPTPVVVVERPKIMLAVLPAESDVFPKAAAATTDMLAKATVAGIDKREVSSVSIEVVQLSIECVEATVGCYEAVGKSLAANRLLFAQISPEGAKPKNKKKPQPLKVVVTLFDVDTRAPKVAQKIFDSEKAATDGIADLVTEATR
jgi:hypothetical protein